MTTMHVVCSNLAIIAVLKHYAIVPRGLENKLFSFKYSLSIYHQIYSLNTLHALCAFWNTIHIVLNVIFHLLLHVTYSYSTTLLEFTSPCAFFRLYRRMVINQLLMFFKLDRLKSLLTIHQHYYPLIRPLNISSWFNMRYSDPEFLI